MENGGHGTAGPSPAATEVWARHCEAVVTAGPETGFVQFAEGFRRPVGGTAVKGRMLAVDWASPGDVHSAILFKADDGRSAFVRLSCARAVGQCPESVFEALDAAPYSSMDPTLHPARVSAGLVSRCCGGLGEAQEQLIPYAARFLAECYDPAVLGVGIGRPVTGSEYRFLCGGPLRRQAVEAFPFLLPTLVSELGTERADAVVATVDRGRELIPVLCRRFGVEPNVVRSMAALPALQPKAYALGERMAADADAYALAFSLIAPEQRPGKEGADRFARVLAWTETVLREAGGNASRPAVAEAAAEIWKRLRRRPYALPEYPEVAWLSDLAEAVKAFPGLEPSPAEGTVCGKRKSFPPHVWAVLYALCRYHPTDLAAAGREWTRRETAYVRHAVREAFPPGYPIPATYPELFEASNGWRARRVGTVGALVEHAAAASNCLAGYLPSLLRRMVAVYALENPAGETEGHFDLRPDENDAPAVGQVKRFRNRKALPAMEAAAVEAAAKFSAEWGQHFPPPLPNRKGGKGAVALADSAVDAARAAAHWKTVEGILGKAAERFSVNGYGGYAR